VSDDAILRFDDSQKIGRVSSVDTSRVVIDAENSSLVTTILVGNLIAIEGSIASEYLIGITERVTRALSQGFIDQVDQDETQAILGPMATDAVIATLLGTYRTVDGDRRNTFKRGADSFPQIDRSCFVIDSSNLQRFMGLLGADLPEHQRLKIGHFSVDPRAEAILNGDKFFQRHAAVLGSTGTGKSWAVALLLERARSLPHSNIIVLDMHGEYHPLADPTTGFGSYYRIAGPGDLSDPRDDVVFLPYWLLNRDEMLSMILDRSDQNAPNQASRFTSHVRELKANTLDKNKKSDVKATFTVDSPIPYDLRDLVALLKDDDQRKGEGVKGPVKGDWEGKLTRFISRLEAKIEDRRYGFLFQPPKTSLNYSWLQGQVVRLLTAKPGKAGIKIIDFSEVPSDVLPVVTGTFARLLYNIQFWTRPERRTPFAIICDEAHLYLPVKEDSDAVEKQALATFERIAKEGRKYGVSIVAVSQRPSDVSRTILSQCNNFLALRLTNESDQNVVKRLMPDSMAGVVSILPLLDVGEALMLGDSVLLPTRIKLDKPEIPPASATRNFWTEWATMSPDVGAIAEAVETLRSQTRPDE
jgi:hypothetical protein